MASITFPTPRPEPSATDDDDLYTFPFEATSSFQINPHSNIPPRSVRNSVVTPISFSQSHFSYGKENRKEDVEKFDHDEDKDEHDCIVDGAGVDEKAENALQRFTVRNEEIWRDLFVTSNGRDKAFKLMQYSIRLYLLFHTSLTTSRLLRRPTRPPWERDFVNRLDSTASGLSLARKLLLLFNWLGPLTAITAQQAIPFTSEHTASVLSNAKKKPFLHTMLYAPPPVLLDLANSVSDDVATLSRLGLLGKKLGNQAERFSNWCWLVSTLVGLVENGVERQMICQLRRTVESRMYNESMSVPHVGRSKSKMTRHDENELERLQTKDVWLQLSRAKLVMDLIFVSYDVFKIQKLREPIKAMTGLISAILSTMKLYHNQRDVIRKSMTLGR